MTPPFDPILFKIGENLAIHWYGVLIVVGIILAANIAAYLAKRADMDPDKVWDMLLIVVIIAIIGARLYHVVSSPAGGQMGWEYYKENPLKAFYIWEGGLGIYGAIIGGALGILIFCLVGKLRPLQWMDFAAPGVAIGQSIGRWGNFINYELYGPPTTLPWGLRIPEFYRIAPYRDMAKYPEDTLFQPTFLYESLAALILCLVLLWVTDKYQAKLKEGDLLVGYLMGYSIIRFFTEFLRPDAWMMGSLATAQIVAIVFIAAGAVFMTVRHWPARQSQKAS
ncbi:MAG: prolipoprotein diacylglyceryl transferase [Anaerolineae bacterium]|nr:prolipoprotein diacylglyceryl transferase [Anaerolineae bacterium]